MQTRVPARDSATFIRCQTTLMNDEALSLTERKLTPILAPRRDRGIHSRDGSARIVSPICVWTCDAGISSRDSEESEREREKERNASAAKWMTFFFLSCTRLKYRKRGFLMRGE